MSYKCKRKGVTEINRKEKELETNVFVVWLNCHFLPTERGDRYYGIIIIIIA